MAVKNDNSSSSSRSYTYRQVPGGQVDTGSGEFFRSGSNLPGRDITSGPMPSTPSPSPQVRADIVVPNQGGASSVSYGEAAQAAPRRSSGGGSSAPIPSNYVPPQPQANVSLASGGQARVSYVSSAGKFSPNIPKGNTPIASTVGGGFLYQANEPIINDPRVRNSGPGGIPRNPVSSDAQREAQFSNGKTSGVISSVNTAELEGRGSRLRGKDFMTLPTQKGDVRQFGPLFETSSARRNADTIRIKTREFEGFAPRNPLTGKNEPFFNEFGKGIVGGVGGTAADIAEPVTTITSKPVTTGLLFAAPEAGKAFSFLPKATSTISPVTKSIIGKVAIGAGTGLGITAASGGFGKGAQRFSGELVGSGVVLIPAGVGVGKLAGKSLAAREATRTSQFIQRKEPVIRLVGNPATERTATKTVLENGKSQTQFSDITRGTFTGTVDGKKVRVDARQTVSLKGFSDDIFVGESETSVDVFRFMRGKEKKVGSDKSMGEIIVQPVRGKVGTSVLTKSRSAGLGSIDILTQKKVNPKSFGVSSSVGPLRDIQPKNLLFSKNVKILESEPETVSGLFPFGDGSVIRPASKTTKKEIYSAPTLITNDKRVINAFSTRTKTPEIKIFKSEVKRVSKAGAPSEKSIFGFSSSQSVLKQKARQKPVQSLGSETFDILKGQRIEQRNNNVASRLLGRQNRIRSASSSFGLKLGVAATPLFKQRSTQTFDVGVASRSNQRSSQFFAPSLSFSSRTDTLVKPVSSVTNVFGAQSTQRTSSITGLESVTAQTGGGFVPFISTPTRSTPGFIPAGPALPTPGFGRSGGFSLFSKRSASFRYAPSLSASVFKTKRKGKAPKSSTLFSGLEERPFFSGGSR